MARLIDGDAQTYSTTQPRLMTQDEIDAWADTPERQRIPVCVEFRNGETDWFRYTSEPLRVAVRVEACRIWTAMPTDELRETTPWDGRTHTAKRVTCAYCNNDIHDSWKWCPYCGRVIEWRTSNVTSADT